MKTRLLGSFYLSPFTYLTAISNICCGSGDKRYQVITMRIYQLVISSYFVLLLGGCGPPNPYFIEQPNPYYSTSTKLTLKEIHVWKVVELNSFQEALFIRGQDPESFVKPLDGGLPAPISTIRGKPTTWVPSVGGFDEFIRSSFDNIGYFNTVKFYPQLEESPKIQKENYLVADYMVGWEGGYDYTFHIRFTNPKNNEVLFHASHEYFRWGERMDRPLFFPVFNSVIDWINECTS